MVCVEFGWSENDDERRLAFYRANKLPESRKDWHPVHHFDRFLKACLKIRGQRDTRDRERERLLHRIRLDAQTAGLDEAYLKKLSTDLHGLSCWDEMAIDDLTNFRNAIHNRAGKKLGTGTATRAPRKMRLDPAKRFTPSARATAPELNPF